MAKRDSPNGAGARRHGVGRAAPSTRGLAALSLGLVAFGVAGTGLLAVARREPPGRVPALVPAVASGLEASIARAEQEARARAAALAARPRLTWIVATDEATVRNLTPAEIGLRAEPGERIQLAQVMLNGPSGLKGAGAVSRLLSDPPGADIPVALAAFGPQLFISDRNVYVAAVGAIVPHDRRDELRGLVAVARLVDLNGTLQRVAEAGAGARLDVGGRALGLGVARDLSGTARRSIEVTLHAPGARASLTLSMAAPEPSRRRAFAAAVLLFLTVFGAGMLWTLGRARGGPAVGGSSSAPG